MILFDYVLIAIVALMSVLAVFETIRDKAAAKSKGRRTPEATLMALGAAGGALAEFIVMLIIRHKTKHVKFMVGLPLLILLHAVIAYLYITRVRGLLVL